MYRMKQQSSTYSKRATLGGYKILLLLLCATALVSFSTNTSSTGKWHDKKEGFSCNGQFYMGYVFDRSYLVYKSIDLQQSRVN